MSEKNEKLNSIKQDICKVLKDFIRDILTTFPEYKDKLDNNLITIVTAENIESDDYINARDVIFEYFKSVYPKRFFDILYQNVACLKRIVKLSVIFCLELILKNYGNVIYQRKQRKLYGNIYN